MHEWESTVNNRVNGAGCPYCAGKKACEDNCLATVNPALAAEWHPTKNGALKPIDVTPYSNKGVWWECSKGHEWRALVSNRSNGRGCQRCSGGAISKVSQQWLDSLGVPEEFREYSIRLPGRKRAVRVDGFDPKTNTAYEFLGDFWHGNPEVYDFNGINPTSKKTYGSLYRKTLRRFEQLRRAGYNVVFIWEREFLSK